MWPNSPQGIKDFSALPNSSKSTLSGDTVELPNISAYFSNNYRNFVLPFYINEYKKVLNISIAPLVLIHPPETAYTFIKDQTQATYLIELTYPLRDSLFINGLEPFDEFTKEQRYKGAVTFVEDSKSYETKVTLRYYPSNYYFRFLAWLGIISSVIILYKTTRKVIYSNE